MLRPPSQSPGLSISQSLAAPRAAVSRRGSEISGKVIRVADGDTITILDPTHPSAPESTVKVRIVGIDAPEKKQPFGEVCRKTLADEIAGRTIRVTSFGKDRFGRTLGQIWFEGRDIGLTQVEKGCAWHYRQYAKVLTPAMRETYSGLEEASKGAKRGLWRDPAPEAPWEFRKSGRRREVVGSRSIGADD